MDGYNAKMAIIVGMKLQNDLILRVARGEYTERPPVWLMRQAGRILPQYRALRAGLADFKALLFRPDLAAEATLQPIDELGVDAAIIFSDILVVPEAMGLPYDMVEKRGPHFPRTIQTAADVAALRSPAAAAAELGYVYSALEQTKRALQGRVPLIGFAGAPWTILAYMVEGQGSKTFAKAKRFLYCEPALAHELLEKITATTIAYLQEKVVHGADMLQLFDSWAGILSPAQYRTFAIPYLRQIAAAFPAVPVTIFSKGAWFVLEDLGQLPCAVVGLDWNIDPQEARQRIGNDKTLQGNLDPCLLYADLTTIAQETNAMLDAFGPRHIANLGHGVYPDTPLEAAKTFVNTVKAYRYAPASTES